jgi:hypothetical protein
MTTNTKQERMLHKADMIMRSATILAMEAGALRVRVATDHRRDIDATLHDLETIENRLERAERAFQTKNTNGDHIYVPNLP